MKSEENMMIAEQYGGQYSIVSETARIGDNVKIGNYCEIMDGAEIGDNVILGDRCTVRKRCKVGSDTRLGERCTLADGTVVGRNCDLKYEFVATDTPRVGEKRRTPCVIGDNVKAGARVTVMPGLNVGNNVEIGAHSQVRCDIPDGQTWWGNPAGPNGCQIENAAKVANGEYIRCEGGVEIDPTVTFQSHVTVKRGLWKGTKTKIGKKTYVCSFSNVGHNVQVGDECFIATGTKIAGDAVLGHHVYTGPGCEIAWGKKVGDWVKIRTGEVVDRDIPSHTYYGKDGKMVPNRYSPVVQEAFRYYARISVRNGKDMIAACVDSLLNQTIKPKALIVVDDGSTDGTTEILESYGEKIHVIKTGNKERDYKRLYTLWNLTFDHIQKLDLQCNYFLSTGGDCIFEPNYAERVLRQMYADPDLVVASGDYEDSKTNVPRGTGRIIRLSWFDRYWPNGLPGTIGYEEEIIERARMNGYRFTVVKEARFNHPIKMGTIHKFKDYGNTMRAFGYYPPYAVYRCLALVKDIGFASAMKVLSEFLTYRPAPSGYYSQYEPELRQYVSKRQRRNMLNFLTNGRNSSHQQPGGSRGNAGK